MGRDDDTVISADDTVIIAEDTIIGVPAEHTIIEPEFEDTALTGGLGKVPVQGASTQAPQVATQPMRRLTDGRLAAPRPGTAFGVKLVTGERFDLTSPVVIGRAPRHAWSGKNRVSQDNAVQLVTVPSREGRVSSTHAELRQVGDVVVVTDLRSTNGTRVSLVGGARGASVQLAPGDSMAVGEGAVVDIGDGNRIEVTREKPRDASKDIAR